MNCLETGVLCYTYDYAIWDSAYNHTDSMYDNVKTVVTDFYWQNCNYNQIPANPINYQTLEHIKDLIEEERYEREKAVGKIQHYVEKEYTQKLNDEIRRSNDVDAEMHKLIKANECDSINRDNAIEDRLNEEIRRSTDVDIELHKLIKEKADGATAEIGEAVNTVTTALNNEISRATTKENEIATNLTTEINRVTAEINTTRDSIEAESNRAKAAEKLVTDSLNAETDRAIERENAINSKVNELVENLGDEIERSLEKDREHKQELDIEVNRAKAEENRIENALTVESNRAKAKEDELTTSLASEVNRAKTVEKDITDALQALKTSVNSKNTDVLDALNAEIARAKGAEKDVADKLVDEVSRATAKENELKNSIDTTNAALTNEVSRATAKEAEIVASVGTVSDNLSDEVARAKAEEKAIKDSVSAVDAKVVAESERAIAKENELNTAISGNTTSINDLKSKVDVINGEGVGSIKHAVEDSKHYTDDEIAKLKASTSTDLTNTLKDYATKKDVDDRIKEVIGTAPEALDTLGEIASVLNGNGDAIDAINGVLVGKADKADTYTKSEVDATVAGINSDIATETSRATAAESTLTTNLNTEVNRAKGEEARIEAKFDGMATDVANEVTRAKAAEKANADAIAAEVKRATDADVEQAANILAETNRAKNAEKVIGDKVDVLNGDSTVIGSVAHAVADAKHYADDVVAKANSDADAKYQPKGDYLTEHQDISGLATKSELTTEANRAKGVEATINDDITALRTALKNSIKVENESLIITL